MATVPRAERAAARRTALSKGLAIPPASPGGAPGFPITDADHWDKARQAVGRVKDPARRVQVAKLLRKTAPQFGKTQALGKSWAAPAGASMASPDLGIYLAETAKTDHGETLTCPECGHVAPAGDFGASGASLDKQPGDLRTPAPSTGYVRSGVPLTVKGGAAHALTAGTRSAVELAAGTVRRPIHGPMDVLVARGGDGTAVLRHRNGGAQIASLRKTAEGKWVADRQRPGPDAPRPSADEPDGSGRAVERGDPRGGPPAGRAFAVAAGANRVDGRIRDSRDPCPRHPRDRCRQPGPA